MPPETGIAAGGRGGSAGTDGAGALDPDSAAQDASIPAVPPLECIPTCLWEVLSSCIDPGATAVAPIRGDASVTRTTGRKRTRALVCDADDQFYFVSPSTGVVDLIAWLGSCYVGGRLVYTKRPRYGGSAFNGSVLYEDPEGRTLVEVFDPYSLGTGPTVYCGGMDAEGAGEVMLLGEALDPIGLVGGIVETDAAPDGAGLAADAAGSL